jgi:hypothetical protein
MILGFVAFLSYTSGKGRVLLSPEPVFVIAAYRINHVVQ